MKPFFRKPKWDEVFQINGRGSIGRTLLVALFWVWGWLGLAAMLLEATALFKADSVGIGTSGYFTAECTLWIGGMVLFGLGSLICGRELSIVKRAAEDDYGDVRVTR